MIVGLLFLLVVIGFLANYISRCSLSDQHRDINHTQKIFVDVEKGRSLEMRLSDSSSDYSCVDYECDHDTADQLNIEDAELKSILGWESEEDYHLNVRLSDDSSSNTEVDLGSSAEFKTHKYQSSVLHYDSNSEKSFDNHENNCSSVTSATNPLSSLSFDINFRDLKEIILESPKHIEPTKLTNEENTVFGGQVLTEEKRKLETLLRVKSRTYSYLDDSYARKKSTHSNESDCTDDFSFSNSEIIFSKKLLHIDDLCFLNSSDEMRIPEFINCYNENVGMDDDIDSTE
jgi:hypothetical protein